MSFQDSIRDNIKTKEQAAEEQSKARLIMVENTVRGTLDNIRHDMMELARNGRYQTVDGKRVIECCSEVYRTLGHVVGVQTVQKGAFGKKLYRTYITFGSGHKEEADMILQGLRAEAEKDGISVIGFRAGNLYSGKNSTQLWEIPSLVEGFAGQHFSLLVKCQMEV